MDYLTLKRHATALNNIFHTNSSLITRICKTSGNAIGLILKHKKSFSCLVIQVATINQGLWIANKWEELDSDNNFINRLNRCIRNARLLSTSLLGDESKGQFDRVLDIFLKVTDPFFGGDKFWHLICEFTGRVANILLCDENYIITDMLKKTTNNNIFSEYKLPDSLQLVNPFTCTKSELEQAFRLPNDLWIEHIGGISPNIRKEILYKNKTDSSSCFTETFTSMLQSYASENSIYTYYTAEKLKAISALELSFMASKFNVNKFSSVNEAILWVENKLFKQRRLIQIKKQVVARFNKALKFRQKQIAEQNLLMNKYKNYEHYQKLGNLILANLSLIKPRSKSIVLKDWETNKSIRIELNPHTTPARNAQKYFHLAKKAKRGIALVKTRTEKLQQEVKWLEEQIWLAENSDNEADLQVSEAKKKNKRNKAVKNGKRNKSQYKHAHKIKPYLEINGCKYYVGKNGKQNDIVTFKTGKRGDQWFHANDVPGAHVVLKKQTGEITEQDLYLGALLAAKFSFAKNSSKVAVDTTDVSNVKKVPKGGAGQVSYTKQRTLFVNPSKPIELEQQNSI